MGTVFLGIGSNRGDRYHNLITAVTLLEERVLSDARMATIYATEPWGKKDQPWFLNTVVQGYCSVTSAELLHHIQTIERELGRNREAEVQWGPRTIDIDILLFDKHRIDTAELQVPHPQMKNRKFVLIPLLELDPFVTDPETGSSYTDYLSRLIKQGIYFFTLRQYSSSFNKASRDQRVYP